MPEIVALDDRYNGLLYKENDYNHLIEEPDLMKA